MLFEQETYTMCSSYHTLTSVAVTANTLESISGPLLYFALFTSAVGTRACFYKSAIHYTFV